MIPDYWLESCYGYERGFCLFCRYTNEGTWLSNLREWHGKDWLWSGSRFRSFDSQILLIKSCSLYLYFEEDWTESLDFSSSTSDSCWIYFTSSLIFSLPNSLLLELHFAAFPTAPLIRFWFDSKFIGISWACTLCSVPVFFISKPLNCLEFYISDCWVLLFPCTSTELFAQSSLFIWFSSIGCLLTLPFDIRAYFVFILLELIGLFFWFRLNPNWRGWIGSLPFSLFGWSSSLMMTLTEIFSFLLLTMSLFFCKLSLLSIVIDCFLSSYEQEILLLYT